jgi:hypothetical protein
MPVCKRGFTRVSMAFFLAKSQLLPQVLIKQHSLNLECLFKKELKKDDQDSEEGVVYNLSRFEITTKTLRGRPSEIRVRDPKQTGQSKLAKANWPAVA